MPRTRRTLVDPDFGEIELPQDSTPEEMERQKNEASELTQAMLRSRFWPPGSVERCARCGERAFAGKDDIVFKVDVPGVEMVFFDVRGGECSACGLQRLEWVDETRVARLAGPAIVSDHEVKVSNFGANAVGTYWPRDLVRNLRLSPDCRAYVRVLDEDTAVVRILRPEGIRVHRRKTRGIRPVKR